jgi:hypothetical protein
MSVDTTFKPIGATYLLSTTAIQPTPDASGTATFRLRCLVAGYVTWGRTNAVTAAGAPGATPSANTIGVSIVGQVTYIEVPAASFFISSVASSFEITPGQGGTGG